MKRWSVGAQLQSRLGRRNGSDGVEDEERDVERVQNLRREQLTHFVTTQTIFMWIRGHDLYGFAEGRNYSIIPSDVLAR